MVPESEVTDQAPVPPELPYWTDQPARLTTDGPALCSSMKSFLYVAPEFPPPPYTWLMTTPPPLERSRVAWSAGLRPVMRSAETQATKSAAGAAASSHGRRANGRARFNLDGDIEMGGVKGGREAISDGEARN